MPRKKTPKPPPDPFRWFDSSPEVIRLVVMMYVKYPLSLRNVEALLHEREIDISREGADKLTDQGREKSRVVSPFPVRRPWSLPPRQHEPAAAECGDLAG